MSPRIPPNAYLTSRHLFSSFFFSFSLSVQQAFRPTDVSHTSSQDENATLCPQWPGRWDSPQEPSLLVDSTQIFCPRKHEIAKRPHFVRNCPGKLSPFGLQFWVYRRELCLSIFKTYILYTVVFQSSWFLSLSCCIYNLFHCGSFPSSHAFSFYVGLICFQTFVEELGAIVSASLYVYLRRLAFLLSLGRYRELLVWQMRYQ